MAELISNCIALRHFYLIQVCWMSVFMDLLFPSQSQIEEALKTFRLAVEQSANQRETRLVCIYEIGM